jgi:hypothetical protein
VGLKVTLKGAQVVTGSCRDWFAIASLVAISPSIHQKQSGAFENLQNSFGRNAGIGLEATTRIELVYTVLQTVA